jgi:hypothetical protein
VGIHAHGIGTNYFRFTPWLHNNTGLGGWMSFVATSPDGFTTTFQSSGQFATAQWLASPVPEPAQQAMLVAGVLLCWPAMRRRQRA